MSIEEVSKTYHKYREIESTVQQKLEGCVLLLGGGLTFIAVTHDYFSGWFEESFMCDHRVLTYILTYSYLLVMVIVGVIYWDKIGGIELEFRTYEATISKLQCDIGQLASDQNRGNSAASASVAGGADTAVSASNTATPASPNSAVVASASDVGTLAQHAYDVTRALPADSPAQPAVDASTPIQLCRASIATNDTASKSDASRVPPKSEDGDTDAVVSQDDAEASLTSSAFDAAVHAQQESDTARASQTDRPAQPASDVSTPVQTCQASPTTAAAASASYAAGAILTSMDNDINATFSSSDAARPHPTSKDGDTDAKISTSDAASALPTSGDSDKAVVTSTSDAAVVPSTSRDDVTSAISSSDNAGALSASGDGHISDVASASDAAIVPLTSGEDVAAAISVSDNAGALPTSRDADIPRDFASDVHISVQPESDGGTPAQTSSAPPTASDRAQPFTAAPTLTDAFQKQRIKSISRAIDYSIRYGRWCWRVHAFLLLPYFVVGLSYTFSFPMAFSYHCDAKKEHLKKMDGYLNKPSDSYNFNFGSMFGPRDQAEAKDTSDEELEKVVFEEGKIRKLKEAPRRIRLVKRMVGGKEWDKCVTLFTRGKGPISQQLSGESDSDYSDFRSKILSLAIYDTMKILHLKGDRKDFEFVKPSLSAEGFDALYDVNGREADEVKPILHALPNIEQFIYCSSAGVYLKSNLLPHFEIDAVDPKSRRKEKLNTENLLDSRDVKWTSLRPVYIYGPLNYNPVEECFFRRLKAGRPIPIPNSGVQIIQLGHAKAVIEANIFLPLVHLLQHAESDIKEEAAWAISNATSWGSPEQI